MQPVLHMGSRLALAAVLASAAAAVFRCAITCGLCVCCCRQCHVSALDEIAEQQLPALDLQGLITPGEEGARAAAAAWQQHSGSSSSSSSTQPNIHIRNDGAGQLPEQQDTDAAGQSHQQLVQFPVIRSLEGRPLAAAEHAAATDSSTSPEQQRQQQYAAPPAPLYRQSPPPPLLTAQGDSNQQCTEYWMPPHSVSAPASTSALPSAAAAAAGGELSAAALLGPGTAVARRRLAQLAPKYCGKLGTYVPNYYSNVDGSMFGISIAPNADGSVIAVGSPLNGPEAKDPGGSSVLTSWSDKTCEYAVVPLWQPEGCYKYFGAQVRQPGSQAGTQAPRQGLVRLASMAGCLLVCGCKACCSSNWAMLHTHYATQPSKACVFAACA